MTTDGKRPLGIKEIAHELGICTKTVRRYHAKKTLKTFRTGGDSGPIKMRKIDLDKFLKRGR